MKAKEKKAGKKVEELEQKAPLKKRVLREILSWVWVIAAFLLIQATLVQARVIPSGSMEQTYLIGDHLLVTRFGYDAQVPLTSWHLSLWRDPQRQQVVVFHPPIAGGHDYIKRVIGAPGDRIEIRQGAVWINGKPLLEPYLWNAPNPADNMAPRVIPPKHYFVMGDNRGNSYDSRYWGTVPRENIIGTPLFIYMSVDAPEEAWQPGNLQERFLAYANAVVRPRLVRWGRLFTAP